MLRLKALPGLMAVLVTGFALGDEAIPNWPAPATWSPHSASRGASAMGAITSPLPFIGVAPCRQYDSRNFTPLPQNTSRAVVLSGAPCGLPTGIAAVSVNITIFNISGATGNGVFQVGIATAPTFAWINFPPTEAQRGNAGALPLDSLGQLWVRVLMGAGQLDFTVDVNGYYASAGTGSFNTFLGLNAGNFTMTGDSNTGLGRAALSNNTTGHDNTVTGAFALTSNITGHSNTAAGANALVNNTAGAANTATGFDALFYNTTGNANTATGYLVLVNNTTGGGNTAIGVTALNHNTTGDSNTAIGEDALLDNTTGVANTASGIDALWYNTTGYNNTATGAGALFGNTTGSGNIGIGVEAGFYLTTGNNNICIGNPGVADESSAIRIGTVGTQTATFIAGISGATSSGGVGVFVNSSGQLGTTTSTRRVKEEIREIAEESDGLMKLRPVAFKYKPQIDPTGLVQYGLIAEEVAEVMPEMVQFSPAGEAETVRYHFLAPLLLNELQKQHQTIEEQGKQVAMLQKEKDEQITLLEARLAALEEQFRERRPTDKE